LGGGIITLFEPVYHHTISKPAITSPDIRISFSSSTSSLSVPCQFAVTYFFYAQQAVLASVLYPTNSLNKVP
jgi:hypothetical protein